MVTNLAFVPFVWLDAVCVGHSLARSFIRIRRWLPGPKWKNEATANNVHKFLQHVVACTRYSIQRPDEYTVYIHSTENRNMCYPFYECRYRCRFDRFLNRKCYSWVVSVCVCGTKHAYQHCTGGWWWCWWWCLGIAATVTAITRLGCECGNELSAHL